MALLSFVTVKLGYIDNDFYVILSRVLAARYVGCQALKRAMTKRTTAMLVCTVTILHVIK